VALKTFSEPASETQYTLDPPHTATPVTAPLDAAIDSGAEVRRCRTPGPQDRGSPCDCGAVPGGSAGSGCVGGGGGVLAVAISVWPKAAANSSAVWSLVSPAGSSGVCSGSKPGDEHSEVCSRPVADSPERGGGGGVHK
jgi:hypothetical protein